MTNPKGRRVPWPEGAIPVEIEKLLAAGDYCGPWLLKSRPFYMIRNPFDGEVGVIESPPHQIVEEPDGALTVSPSIQYPNGGWHGYLKRGEWSQ